MKIILLVTRKLDNKSSSLLKKHIQKSVYDGIDLHIEVINNNLKYEFHVLPFSKADKIKLEYLGLNKIEINEEIELCFIDLGIVTEKKPIAYQYINDDTVNVNCQFMLEENTVSFFPDGYNLNNKLIMSPVLKFFYIFRFLHEQFGYTAASNLDFYIVGAVLRQAAQQLLAHMIQHITIQQAVQT